MSPYVVADPYATSHFSHRALLHELRSSAGGERAATAVVLSRIAEFDERRLFLQEGYDSMHAFCVHDLHYSDGAAYKRITAARVAQRFPVVFVAVADGRLHLSGVVMLSKYLAMGNPDQLLAAAFYKTKDEIERLIAERFPRPDLPERLQALAPPTLAPVQWTELSPGTVPATMPSAEPTAAAPAIQLSPGTVDAPAPRARLVPLAPQRFGFQFTGDQETHDAYERVRNLLSHEVPTGEMALVFKRALRIAEAELMKRKFAATDRPRPSGGSVDPRHIPAAVKRAVRERDGDQCAFVSESGHRCEARKRLEFDHIEPVARGGKATVDGTRLCCRAHNQYAAERAFGAEFMSERRAEARALANAGKQSKGCP